MAVLVPPDSRQKSRRRRTQRERRESARARLLDATVECLVELGWTGTSTTEVARRAGLSRGAQQHHYRTKSELVAAAAEHLLRRQQVEFEQAFAALPPDRRDAASALDLLWEVYRGPTFTALLELGVAARTNPDLRRHCAEIPERVTSVVIETFHRLFPDAPHQDIMPTVLRGLVALFSGLALAYGVDGDRLGRQAEVLELAKTLGLLLVPGGTASVDAQSGGTASDGTGSGGTEFDGAEPAARNQEVSEAHQNAPKSGRTGSGGTELGGTASAVPRAASPPAGTADRPLTEGNSAHGTHDTTSSGRPH